MSVLLHSERLSLRPLALSDAPAIFDLRSNDVVRKFIDRIKYQDLEEAEAFIEKIQDGIAADEYKFWVICLKNNPKLLGTICFWNFSEDRQCAELGYELFPTYHRKGIMNEACQVVLEYGFEQLNLQKIEAFTHKDNTGSRGLLLKNQFQLIPNRREKGYPDNRIFVLQKPI